MAASPARTWRIEPLGEHHDRTAFASGAEPLDRYFKAQAGQDVRRRVASCFVLVEDDTPSVLGFYTLSATSIAVVDLPEAVTRRLPRYPLVPATLLGRLAVDATRRGQGLGTHLLMDALARILRSEIASFAMVVEAKDRAAEQFYARFGMRRLPSAGRRLFIPVAELAKLRA